MNSLFKKSIFACLLLMAATVAQAQFSGAGAGTAASPYIITNAQQLDEVRNDLTAYYRLGSNIDLTAYLASGGAGYAKWNTAGWLPIGASFGNLFEGAFDGAGHTITGLWINRPSTDCVGLFGMTASTSFTPQNIENLGVEISATGISGRNQVGGLVGDNRNCNITNCYVTGNVSGTDYVGGLVGENLYSDITRSYATGNVTGSNYLGGLVGRQTNREISQSYATGSVNGNQHIGGLVGHNFNAYILNCYATGSTNGTNNIGALVGRNQAYSITNCYAVGRVTGNTNVGGLVGYNDSGATISDSFFDRTTTSQTNGVGSNPSAGGVTAVATTAQMKQQSTFTGWNFTAGSVWAICNGSTYPYFQWQGLNCSNYMAVITRPANTTFYHGGISGTIRVAVSVAPGATATPSSYQWYSNTSNNNSSGTPISGANSASLTIPTGLTAGTYYYYCVINSVPSNVATVTVLASFCGGTGTSADPYQICTAEQLDRVRNFRSAGTYFILNNDIDLSTYLAVGGAGHNGGAGWLPIGTAGAGNTFQGQFNGAGHKITGLWINRPTTDCVGLFGVTANTSGRIENLGVEIATAGVIGQDFVGGLVGRTESVTISQCYVSGSGSVRGTNSLLYYVGGLVGESTNSASISNCYATVNVIGGTGGIQSYAGGLVGHASASSLTNCYATGVVSGYGSVANYVGGLVGMNTSSTFTNCFFDTQTTNQANGAGNAPSATGVTGKTTAQMKQQVTFTGWNFTASTGVWAICDNVTYPALQVHGGSSCAPVITINTHPANATVTQGSITGSLSVAASVTQAATPTYQWYSNTGNSNTGGAVISGATAASLTIPTGLTAGTYYYFCEVRAAGATPVRSNVATVTVNSPATPVITITTQPTATTTLTYGSITGNLSVVASVTQSATLSYQWYSNTLASNSGGTSIGGNSASLTIPTTLAADNHYYYCIVSATGATPVTSNVATVRVNAKAITVTADAGQTKTYGDPDPTFTYTCSPALISGDSFTGALARAAGENVGASYAISQGTLDVNVSSNYIITFISSNFSITAKAITVTADAGQTKTYGDPDPASYTYTCTPALIGGDSFAGALARAAGEDAGLYAISQGTLNNGNYAITFNGDNFTITAKQVTVTANSGSSTYGGLSTNPGISATGLVNSETVGILTGLYNDFSITASTTVGTYTLNVAGTLTNSNYTVTTNTGTWTVNKANPTYTPLTGLTATYGDLLSSLTLPAGWVWDTPTNYVGNAGTQTHAATFTPADITNYNILTVSLTVTVSRAKVAKPALTQATFTYSGAPHTVTLNPVSAFYTLSGGNITETAAGNYAATVTLTDANNYEWTDGTATPLSLSWTITAPPLPVYTVTLNQSTGGTATVSHTSATAGASVTLTATPAGANYSLVRWDISPANVTWTSGSATTPSATFTMPAGSVTVTPVFQYSPSPPPIPPQYARRITVEQTIGGTLTADKQYAATRDTVTLTITPDTGYTLEEIIIYQTGTTTPTDVEIQGTGNTRTFFMPAYDVTVTAHFAFGEVANEQLTMNNEQWGAWVHDGILYISGLTQGKPLHIYNVYGQLVYQATVVSDKAAIPLPARGLYIIQTNNQTLKTVY